MSTKISARLASRGAASIAAVRALRWFGSTALGGRAAPFWYRRRALAMARDLERLDAVDGVYLLGSTLDTALLGYSDIDLMIVTQLPGVAEELAFRSEIVELARRHNRPIELFPHLDYVEARDLDLLRAMGNAFALELDARWLPLAGKDRRLERPPGVGARHLVLARLLEGVRHWLAQSVELTRPHAAPDRGLQLRVARRLFSGTLAKWLGEPRLPLAVALERARGRTPGEATLALARDPTRASGTDPRLIEDFLTASLEVLDAHVASEFGPRGAVWPDVAEAPARPAWDAERWEKVARSSGFASFEVAARGPFAEAHLGLCTTRPETSARAAVIQLRGLIARVPALPERWFGRSNVPVLLTPALRRAAALIAPAPLLALGLDGPERSLAPARADLEILTKIALVQSLWRPRGRTLRFGRRPGHTRSAMVTEVFHHGPLLLALLRGEPLAFWGPSPGDPGEAAAIARLHELHAEVRAALREQS